MTVKSAMAFALNILQENNIEAPAKESGVLLAFVLKKDVSWLYAHPEYCLEPNVLEEYCDIVSQRSKSMPFSYIVNNREFMSLDFYVNPDCLIPRPETEILVEAALSQVNKDCKGALRVLDVGAGSGAICVSIACYAPKTFIDALDISPKALEIAAMNAKRHCVENRIRFINADFLQWENKDLYDIVLSNPPYIPKEEIYELMPEVKNHEPLFALDGGRDGLLYYRALSERIKRLLVPGGDVFVEVGKGQAEHVAKMFSQQGLKISVYKDLSGISRVVHAYF